MMSRVKRAVSIARDRRELRGRLNMLTLLELRAWLKAQTGRGYTTSDKLACVCAVLDLVLPNRKLDRQQKVAR